MLDTKPFPPTQLSFTLQRKGMEVRVLHIAD